MISSSLLLPIRKPKKIQKAYQATLSSGGLSNHCSNIYGQQCVERWHHYQTKALQKSFSKNEMMKRTFVPSTISLDICYKGVRLGQHKGFLLPPHDGKSSGINFLGWRWVSSIPSSQSKENVQESPQRPSGPIEFPPNVSVELSESSKAPADKSEEPKTLGKEKTGSPAKRSLRQATRFALAAVPSQAHVVMQQQHLITRLLSARFRAWQNLKVGRNQKTPVERTSSTSPVHGFGRKSAKRKRRSTQKGDSVKRRKPSDVSAASESMTETEVSASKEKASKQHLEQHSFLKDTSIEEKVDPSKDPPSRSPPPASEKILTDQLPKYFQPSLEVSLGNEQSSECAKLGSVDSSFPKDLATPSSQEVQQEEEELDRSELLRNYEAVLQVVLSTDIVEADAKRFLAEYRKRCNIKTSQHVEALKRSVGFITRQRTWPCILCVS